MRRKRIGVFGGSFDPPHLGHICLAMEMLEKHSLDEVWFCPAKQNPLKKHPAAVTEEQRTAMVRLAIRGIPGLKCCLVDLERPGPSYTVETLRILHQKLRGKADLYLILGKDSAETFFSWHQPEEIIKLSSIITGSRPKMAGPEIGKDARHAIAQAIEKGLTSTRVMDISSSEIRHRIHENRHVEHLLPQAVWRYIKAHQLYE